MHAYLDGEFVAIEQARIPIWDLGFCSGVAVTEQLRTVSGRIWLLSEHLDRLDQGLQQAFLDWPIPRGEVVQLALKLVQLGLKTLQPADDLGLCIVVTGGDFSKFAPIETKNSARSRLILHSFRLEHARIARLYAQGVSLVTVPTREIPDSCVSRQLKSRSRMHYWIAQQQAQLITPNAQALLLNLQDEVIESPTASLLAITGHSTVCIAPPAGHVLPGTRLQWALHLLQHTAGMTVQRRPIGLDEFRAADEILSLSTPYLALPVTQVDGTPIGEGRPGKCFEQIHRFAHEITGCDLRLQASQFGNQL